MRDLSQLEAEIIALREQVNWLLSGGLLNNASVDRGALQVRSEQGFIIGEAGSTSGSGRVYGTLWIDGVLDGSGQFVWSGAWRFDSGDGEISGNVTLSGDFDLTGVLTAGDVRIEDGKIYVGQGVNAILLDGATGTIEAGDITITAASGGAIEFGNGAKIVANVGSPGIRIESGSGWSGYVAQSGIRFGGAIGEASLTLLPTLATFGADRIQISADELVLGIGTIANIEDVTDWLGRRADGTAGWVSVGSGGPMGSLQWPFSPSLVTSEYGPRDGGFHEGIDFGLGIANVEGTPIPAAGSGTVTESVVGHAGWGNYVKIRHTPSLETLYAHMYAAPSVSVGASVARGQTLGGIGNTGASQGNHLHFEVYVDGVTVNPRSKLPPA